MAKSSVSEHIAHIFEDGELEQQATVLTELSSTYVCADAIVKCVQIEGFVNNLTAHHYDPIDYVLVENYRQNKNIVFISDDKDFQTDGTIDLITA